MPACSATQGQGHSGSLTHQPPLPAAQGRRNRGPRSRQPPFPAVRGQGHQVNQPCQPTNPAFQVPGHQGYQTLQPAVPLQYVIQSTGPSITVSTSAPVLSSVLITCGVCGSMNHSQDNCLRAKTRARLNDENTRFMDILPQIPVTIKPTKTAAALETERKHAEKLAAMKTEERGPRDRVGEDEKSLKDKKGALGLNEPGDLIEWD